ncbi:hypothetical protein [Sutterella wadsworthensis]|uniref:hypothetical protein n=1 Tax=Sutterella wadsworthensis TaxID=40545 RepID=UPI003966AAAE
MNASIPFFSILFTVEIGLKRPGDSRDFSGSVSAAVLIVRQFLGLKVKKDVNRSALWST